MIADPPAAVIQYDESEGSTPSPDQETAIPRRRIICCSSEARRARFIQELVRHPPPNELVRPRGVQPDPQPPEGTTRPSRDRKLPKHFDGFQLNLFSSKKGK